MTQEFRLDLLKSEYAKRATQEEVYSIRKFAREAGMEPSVISKYFRRKRKISNSSFNYLTRSLKLSEKGVAEKEARYFRDREGLYLIDKKLKDLLGQWYSFAILELIHCDDFEADEAWIAKRLGLDLERVRITVEELIKLGAIKVHEDEWEDAFESLTTIVTEDDDELIGRSLQKQLLEQAKHSIDKNSAQDKSHTSVMVAGDQKLVSEVKNKIREFRRELVDFIETNSDQQNCVLNLQINFFPLTKGR